MNIPSLLSLGMEGVLWGSLQMSCANWLSSFLLWVKCKCLDCLTEDSRVLPKLSLLSKTIPSMLRLGEILPGSQASLSLYLQVTSRYSHCKGQNAYVLKEFNKQLKIVLREIKSLLRRGRWIMVNSSYLGKKVNGVIAIKHLQSKEKHY